MQCITVLRLVIAMHLKKNILKLDMLAINISTSFTIKF